LPVNGWLYGPERDDSQKLPPFLTYYATLPEKEKDKGRNTIRNHNNILDLEICTISNE
jgi:hypothetical protein